MPVAPWASCSFSLSFRSSRSNALDVVDHELRTYYRWITILDSRQSGNFRHPLHPGEGTSLVDDHLPASIMCRRRIGGCRTGQGEDGLRKRILLSGLVCVCFALLLVTPGLAAQPAMVRIDRMETAYHVGDDLVISGRTKNLPDGTTIDLNFENPRHPVVPISAYVTDNRYTATIDTGYLGTGVWSVWASTPFPVHSFASSRRIPFMILPRLNPRYNVQAEAGEGAIQPMCLTEQRPES